MMIMQMGTHLGRICIRTYPLGRFLQLRKRGDGTLSCRVRHNAIFLSVDVFGTLTPIKMRGLEAPSGLKVEGQSVRND